MANQILQYPSQVAACRPAPVWYIEDRYVVYPDPMCYVWVQYPQPTWIVQYPRLPAPQPVVHQPAAPLVPAPQAPVPQPPVLQPVDHHAQGSEQQAPGHQNDEIVITRRNAQVHFPVEARLFVGNLQTSTPNRELEKKLEEMLTGYGECWAKVRYGNGPLKVAHVQFRDRAAAEAAMNEPDRPLLYGRELRFEWARGICT
ncbi:hypothetical protein BO70DRAFT_397348 [Aspergillus heteromorphus CBS 117.55]|uniref:RRM domain-containing protein n=1 Tax=Aspergillus heteromorphus CBS 117.55 TaxID=1448321 RepID=A0A317VZP0_9EURO|nr:uncharacterized protein BO70DRAFT_397348 [Aspergillus heteromorphus CBS 117.55]PWY79235.1 hypothetical protein BO70DRAFT_397348 [Aspergillus heteromorphus CBS 117.55]